MSGATQHGVQCFAGRNVIGVKRNDAVKLSSPCLQILHVSVVYLILHPVLTWAVVVDIVGSCGWSEGCSAEA